MIETRVKDELDTQHTLRYTDRQIGKIKRELLSPQQMLALRKFSHKRQ